MTDSMKFGPEWLRNLTGDGCNTGGGGGLNSLRPPRYQLAEHRYGREEMLALFDRSCHPTEPLIGFPSLYVDKKQLPLALITPTDDEQRLWNGGVTSNTGRGRGSSVDRGGRPRPTRTGPHFRGSGFEDAGDTVRSDPIPFTGRTRAFDRPPTDRGWSERNGLEAGDWNGSISPRKESVRVLTGSSFTESNWRRQKPGGDEEETWRVNNRNEKWARGSWRDPSEKFDGDEDAKSGLRRDHKGSAHRSFDSHAPQMRRVRNASGHHDFHDHLPEWATENTGDTSGSFDASGAFHGMYSDDDDDKTQSTKRREPRIRRVSEGNTANNSKSNFNKSYDSVNSGSGFNRSSKSISESSENNDKPNKSLQNNESNQETLSSQDRSESPIKSPKIVLNSPNKPQIIQVVPSVKERNKPVEKLPTVTKQKEEKSKKKDNAKETPTENKINLNNSQLETNKKVEIQSTIERKPHRIPPNLNNIEKEKLTQDHLDRMEQEVAKLIDSSHKDVPPNLMPSVNNNNKNPNLLETSNSQEKWYYRDPQGEVQGPFLASEMAEWWKQGYFSNNLLIRRTFDERYTSLGELMKICGRVPFKPGPTIASLKLTDQVIPPVTGSVPTGIPSSALPKSGIDDPLLMLQYQQLRMLQNQQMFIKQLHSNAINKLSQSEHWGNLTTVEQNQLILQYVRSIEPDYSENTMPSNNFMPSINTQPAPSSVMQLFPQLQQAMKQQTETRNQTQAHHPNAVPIPGVPIDPVQQLMQQMSGVRNLPPMPHHNMSQSPQQSQDDNAIKSWLRQLSANANNHNQAPQAEPVWPQPPPHLNAFNRNWMTQVGSMSGMSSGQMPTSLWDVHPKEMKTEQQILEEQNLAKLQEETKRQEEIRKHEELKKHQQELAKLKQEEELARLEQEREIARLKAEKAKREEDKRRKEDEKKRKEEERLKQEEEQRKQEEKRRKEEEKKREEKRKLDEELNKKKQEEERKKRDELRKQEEKLKKEEEKRKKIEEELRKKEEERLKKEEEVRKKAEAEENARKAEQRRREAEALKKLQERSKAPWAQAPPTPPVSAQASLTEIQRLEREKKAEEQRIQQLLQQQQLAQQKAAEVTQEALADSSKRLQFKWAEKLAAVNNSAPQIKSLAQIQQEEQERMNKTKQQEREKQEKEKAIQKEACVTMQNVSIWGTASQSLNWTNPANNNQTWTSNNTANSGFWDEPTSKTNQLKVSPRQSALMKGLTANPQQQLLQQQQSPQQSPQQQNNNKITKSKSKKEEELVKKLFEQNTAKTDDFTQWCTKALSGLQVSVDIPTFIGFLRDIEAAYEVKEYIRMYLGDGKQCAEFAKQFLEKRSKWRSLQRPQAQADDLCKPAPAINPNTSTDFQEVKSKSKKPKKGKMYKVDSKMLGFSVMSAPDRINVGDRDYGEGV